jgi:hypothetical protein
MRRGSPWTSEAIFTELKTANEILRSTSPQSQTDPWAFGVQANRGLGAVGMGLLSRCHRRDSRDFVPAPVWRGV